MANQLLDIVKNITFFQALEVSAVFVVTFASYKVLSVILPPLWSPHRKIPGPKRVSWFWGNLKQVINSDDQCTIHEKWYDEYGHVYKYKVIMNNDRLWTNDLKAIQHILTHQMIYEKPSFIRHALGHILGEGLLFVEGAEHKLQRRVMSPAFTVSHLREMTETFVAKSAELRDAWLDIIQNSPEQGSANVEVMGWLSRATLDIIGLAGFNYQFNALKSGEDASELSAAFAETFKSSQGFTFLGVMQMRMPWLRSISFDQRTRNINRNKKIMRRIGTKLILDKQAAVKKELELGIEKGVKERDLLSLLIRSNMSPDVPPSQRLSVDQIMHQIPTFIVAGHETTSTSTTWALYALTRHPTVQKKLRAELKTFPHDNPSMDELNSLVYLDAVVKETMRLHAPVEASARTCVAHDVLPLERPYVDRDGKLVHEIPMRPGDTIMMPILGINRSKEIWGPDAHEFIPERWSKDSPNAVAIPGIWSNLLTFLGGAHACIGFKFAITEMKALLFHLIRTFEFESEIPIEAIGKKVMIVTRPYNKLEKEKGNRLDMIIRPASGI